MSSKEGVALFEMSIGGSDPLMGDRRDMEGAYGRRGSRLGTRRVGRHRLKATGSADALPEAGSTSSFAIEEEGE